MFNVPVVELTAQAATEQRKLVSEVSDLPLVKKNTLTTVRGGCVFKVKPHEQAKHRERFSPFGGAEQHKKERLIHLFDYS